MRTTKSLIFLAGTTIFLSACLGPKFTKRYDTVRPGSAKENILDVSAFVAGSTPSPSVRRLSEIPEDALAEAIKAMSGGAAVTPTQIGALMATRISPSPAQSAPNYTRFSRRIAVTVDYETSSVSSIGEADRLTRLRTDFVLSGNESPKFASWSRLSSPLVEVDLGDLQFTQSNTFSAAAEFDTLAPDFAGLDIEGELARELVENVRLRQNILPLYGVLKDHEARLEQRGSLGRDLVGIQTIDLTITVAADDGSRIVTSFQAPSAARSGPRLQTGIIRPPKSCEPVKLTVNAEGVLRRVIDGDDTNTESDDNVTLQLVGHSGAGDQFDIVSQEQLKVPNWYIRQPGGSTIQMQASGMRGPQDMFFDSIGEASAFFDYMAGQANPPRRIGSATITVAGNPVSQAFFNTAIIDVAERNQTCP